ncbi:MAG: hypothetical protein PHF63_06520 [Herbinix sp.]|nr:hypothetical protein [Herbinix sp.]
MKIKNKLPILLAITILAFLFTGCNPENKIPIVTINDKEFYMKDFFYDVYLVENEGNQLEKYYKDNLGYGYWDYEYEGSTMREMAKSSVLASVVMYEILSDEATEKGMILNQSELSANKSYINNLIHSSSMEELESIGLTYTVLKSVLEKRALGDKYRNELSKNFIIDENAIRNSIDKTAYKEYKTESLYIPTVTGTGPTFTPIKEEAFKSAYKTMLKADQELENGVEFDALLNKYSDLKYFTRDFIYGDNTPEKVYQEASITLKNDEYSPIIKTDYGYYIIHMLDNNSSDKYEQAVQDAVQAEEDTQFDAVYNKIKDQYDITINFEYWDTVNIGSITATIQDE